MDQRRACRVTFTPPLRLREATQSRSRGRGRRRSPKESRNSCHRRSRSRRSRGRRSRLTISRSRSRSQHSRRTSDIAGTGAPGHGHVLQRGMRRAARNPRTHLDAELRAVVRRRRCPAKQYVVVVS